MALRGYLPQLDGIRALAIAAVVAYHLGALDGGWLGVDIFFVLSGYLITTILLADADRQSKLHTFWGRRARRLLPAVLTLLAVLSVYAWLKGPGLVPPQLRSPALATLFYTANWQQIAAGHSYFAQFAAPSPLSHTWSLAIEEQYYLIWPMVLGAFLWFTRDADARVRRRVLVCSILSLAVLSATWMGFAAHLLGANRAYLGTDTRAWELLLGGALAALSPADQPPDQRPRTWAYLAGIGILAVLVGMSQAGGPPAWIWNGGLVAIASGAGLVVVGTVRAPQSLPAKLFATGPMRWLGTISYSLYLWHWPVIVLITPDSSGLSGTGLLLARVTAMLAASVASYYLVERPLRRFDWAGFGRRIRVPALSFASAGLAATAALIIGGTVAPPVARSSLVSATGLPAPSPRQAQVQVDLPDASAANPYRVWIMGDSVMADGSPGLTAALQATGTVSVVVNSAFPGWGLTRDATWPADVRSVTTRDHPQIVIGTWSWDDTEALQSPGRYLQRLQAAMAALLAPDTGVKLVVLLEFPQTGPATAIADPAQRSADWMQRTEALDAWDNAARDAVDAFPGHALYLTTDQLFAPDGRFYTWFRTSKGTWLRGRKLDNTHFCPFGAAEWGALLTQELSAELRLPAMKSGWELGSWSHDRRYNDPPGACPADQPPAGYNGIPVPRVAIASSPASTR